MPSRADVERGGHADDLVGAAERVVEVEEQGVGGAGVVGEQLRRMQRLRAIDADHGHPVAGGLMEALEVGHLLNAEAAPRGPEVDDRGPAQGAELDRAPLQVEQAEVGHEGARAGGVAVAGDVAQEGGVLEFIDAGLEDLDLDRRDFLVVAQQGQFGAGVGRVPAAERGRTPPATSATSARSGPTRNAATPASTISPTTARRWSALTARAGPPQQVELQPTEDTAARPHDRHQHAHGNAPPHAHLTGIFRARVLPGRGAAFPRATHRVSRRSRSSRPVRGRLPADRGVGRMQFRGPAGRLGRFGPRVAEWQRSSVGRAGDS